MEENKSLDDEIIDLLPTLEKFKEEYKSLYYGYYIHKYPDSSYLQYLGILKTFYSRELVERHRLINKNKGEIPDWVIEKKIENWWLETLEFDKKLIIEFENILNFIYEEIELEEGKQIEQEKLIKKFAVKKVKREIKELSNPEKIAVLYKLGIEETLNKFPVKEDRYKFIHELIGGDYSNIKKVMISGVSNDNMRTAQEFINSKTI